jgi:flagellar basal-body rod protein FlgB
MLGRIFNKTGILEKSLDAAWARNEAISQNIANVDTPNYKKKTVEFEQYLSDAIDQSRMKNYSSSKLAKTLDSIDIKVTTDNKFLSTRQDGNNVDIDSEAASLAKNSIRYNTLAQSLSSSFNRLKSVISEGKR